MKERTLRCRLDFRIGQFYKKSNECQLSIRKHLKVWLNTCNFLIILIFCNATKTSKQWTYSLFDYRSKSSRTSLLDSFEFHLLHREGVWTSNDKSSIVAKNQTLLKLLIQLPKAYHFVKKYSYIYPKLA